MNVQHYGFVTHSGHDPTGCATVFLGARSPSLSEDDTLYVAFKLNFIFAFKGKNPACMENVFTLCKVCVPERVVCLLHNTGWFFSDPTERGSGLFSPHKSESNILNKVTVLDWRPIHLLSHAPLSHCLTQSTCRQCMAVFVFSTPTSIAFMKHRWGCSQASRSLGGRLGSAAAACLR